MIFSKRNRFVVLTIFLVQLFCWQSHAQVNIISSSSAVTLAQKLAGAGVIIINPTLNCPLKASGIFTAIIGGIGIDSGIVMSTGYAATQGGINGLNGGSGVLASYNFLAPGDISLNSLAGQNTFDACSLEFDFIPNGDSVQFNYVFSSEEYINATCGPYNDAFAFFISGPGITGQKNMAIVPNTNIPVTINSINNGIPGPGLNLSNCTSMGPGSPFTSYYVDNTNGPYITHKGFTNILEAKYPVAPCSTYHLKMVIADAGNHLYDSGVFIEAGSLQSGNAILNNNAGLNNLGEQFIVKGCSAANIDVVRNVALNTAQTFHLAYSGSAIQNYDINVLPDSVVILPNTAAASFSIIGLLTPKNGKKTINIKLLSPYSCNSTNAILDSVSVVVYDSLSMNILTPDTAICLGDSVLIRVDGDDIMQFNWMPSLTIVNFNQKQPIVFPNQPTTYFLIGNYPSSGCAVKLDSVHFTASPTPTISVNNIVTCSHIPLQLLAQISPPYLGYHFLWSGPNGFSSTMQQPFITNPTSICEGNYTLNVRADTSACISTTTFHVQVITTELPVVKTLYEFCQEEGKNVSIDNVGNNLIWYDENQNNPSTLAPTVNATNIANYLFFVSQIVNGCESEKVSVSVQVKKCCEAEIAIPSAFTPNNDGRNDSWKVLAGFGFVVFDTRIFNRWGQQVFHSTTNEPWDGTIEGVTAEIGDYAYEIQVKCLLSGTVMKKKGFITLIM